MDADDISFEDRLKKQLNFLIKNKNIVATGGQCVVINDNDQIIGYKNFPINPSKLTDMIFWAIPMQQPSMMINLQKLPKNFKWYTPNQSSAEEVNLIFRLMQYGYIANLPDNLLFYRHLSSSLSHVNPKKTFFLTLKSRFQALKLGYRPSPKAVALNLAQIFAVTFIPNSLINEIWYRLRGINRPSGLTVESFSEAKV
jgi:hypothetical protein